MLQTIQHNRIRELRLQRPPVNAINPELVGHLNAAITAAPADCDALVLSGQAGMFSAGLDVRELMTLDRHGMRDFWNVFFELLETLARCPIPIACAMTGHAPAGGAVLSLFCDYRVMSQGKFVFGLNETQVGLLIPGMIQNALKRVAGNRQAERMMVSGSLLSPDQALAAGMLDAVAEDPEQCVTHAIQWCEQLLSLPRHAMLGNRSMLREDLCAPFDRLTEKDVDGFVDGWFSEPTQNTLKALLEQLKKRK